MGLGNEAHRVAWTFCVRFGGLEECEGDRTRKSLVMGKRSPWTVQSFPRPLAIAGVLLGA